MELEDLKDEGGKLTGIVAYGEAKLRVHVHMSEGAEPEPLIGFATDFIGDLSGHDDRARAALSARFVGEYNENWRGYEAEQEDGSVVDATDPELDTSGSAGRLVLEALEVMGLNSVAFIYSDDGLFWGKYLVASSRDGGGAWVCHDLHGA